MEAGSASLPRGGHAPTLLPRRRPSGGERWGRGRKEGRKEGQVRSDQVRSDQVGGGRHRRAWRGDHNLTVTDLDVAG